MRALRSRKSARSRVSRLCPTRSPRRARRWSSSRRRPSTTATSGSSSASTPASGTRASPAPTARASSPRRSARASTGAWIGREVIINPGSDWGPLAAAQGPDFKILGLPHDGTLADRVAVGPRSSRPKPAHLSWEEAAALPLAGLTAWRSLITRAQMGTGDRVLVTGSAAAWRSWRSKFAVASGNEVWVTSSSDKKIRDAVALGAKGGFRYDLDGWAESARQGPRALPGHHRQRGRPGIWEAARRAAPGGPHHVLWRDARQRARAGAPQGVLEAADDRRLDDGQRLATGRP
jgi:hypothetical protein